LQSQLEKWSVSKVQSEEIIQQLLEFVSQNGRLPKEDEPDNLALISAAITTFGSLENALRMAGLLTDSNGIAFGVPEKSNRGKRSELAILRSRYPPEYFLNLLGLNREKNYGPATGGVPTWWERRANSNYVCSNCEELIQKGERYIGMKQLHPGRKGPYGYRGTYSTHYYHIVCLLKNARTDVNNGIHECTNEINANQREIDDFKIEISSKMEEIDNCCRAISQTQEELRGARSALDKTGKWFRNKYVSWSKNREIKRSRDRISIIQDVEIPERKSNIGDLSKQEKSLRLRLNQLDDKIQEFSSVRKP
jgi:hypothetical protein